MMNHKSNAELLDEAFLRELIAAPDQVVMRHFNDDELDAVRNDLELAVSRTKVVSFGSRVRTALAVCRGAISRRALWLSRRLSGGSRATFLMVEGFTLTLLKPQIPLAAAVPAMALIAWIAHHQTTTTKFVAVPETFILPLSENGRQLLTSLKSPLPPDGRAVVKAGDQPVTTVALNNALGLIGMEGRTITAKAEDPPVTTIALNKAREMGGCR
jgi:hypothetical protein